MKKIIAIGGAVIKTGAGEELKKRINEIEMLMVNGGAIFHDFQLALENYTSVPISELIHSTEKLKYSSKYLWDYLRGKKSAPVGSLIRLCEDNNIPVLLFTALGVDYWQTFDDEWEVFAKRSKNDFDKLKKRFNQGTFHYINMGSAVIHPEVFLKAITGIKPNFTADVVDFLDMYRPRTRVAIYGKYYQKEFLDYLNEDFGK